MPNRHTIKNEGFFPRQRATSGKITNNPIADTNYIDQTSYLRGEDDSQYMNRAYLKCDKWLLEQMFKEDEGFIDTFLDFIGPSVTVVPTKREFIFHSPDIDRKADNKKGVFFLEVHSTQGGIDILGLTKLCS